MNNGMETCEFTPYLRFVREVTDLVKSQDVSYDAVKAHADAASAIIVWSTGGLNMSPLGSFEPDIHRDALVANYRRAKICRAMPKRAKQIYEYHLDANGQCVATLRHNIPEWAEKGRPYYHEVYCFGKAGATVFYCYYSQFHKLEWVYAYSGFRDRVPQLSLAYRMPASRLEAIGSFEIYASEMDGEGMVTAIDRYNLYEWTMANEFILSPLAVGMDSSQMDELKNAMQKITINDVDYSILHHRFTLIPS